jgi:hypothetical protein
LRNKALLVVALLICLLVAAAAIGAVVERRRAESRVRFTRAALVMIRDRETYAPMLHFAGMWPRADGSGDDNSGMKALGRVYELKLLVTHAGYVGSLDTENHGWRFSHTLKGQNPTEPVDAWGRTLVYRCPGPVHHQGWDLYSFGPDGIDDRGEGDDILVGEDVASIESAAK